MDQDKNNNEKPVKEINYSNNWPLQYDNLWVLTGTIKTQNLEKYK